MGDRQTADRAGLQKLSIVMPAFNEEANLPSMLDESVAELEKFGDDYEIVVIDDHSADSTGTIADEFAKRNPRVRVIHNRTNLGCHPSELVGLLASTGDGVLFLPADRQILPDQLGRCVAAAAEADYVVTHRAQRADVLGHRMISETYNWLVRVVFRIPAHDVNSSIFVRRNVIEKVGHEVDSTTAFISVELLVRAMEAGFRIAEVDIEHHPRVAGKATGLNLRDISVVPFNLAAFALRLRRLRRSLRGK